MLFTIIILILAAAGGYFAYRWFTLRNALRQTRAELALVRQDLSQNQMLHLPLPDAELSALLDDFNTLLTDIQRERQSYAKRERAFQRQIEAISHDLRTPLTVILGQLKLFKRNHAAAIVHDPELAETVAILEQKTETMKNLVSQFYDYSRLAADDMHLSLSRVDAGRILREALVGNYQLLAERDLAVDVALPEHPLWVLGDEAALARVFQNLLQNASRYAESHLALNAEARDDWLVLCFTNDSRSLQIDDVPRLFERFYTPDDSRHQGSTGLGLTVARALAEEMQGSLTADAEQDGDHLALHFRLALKTL